MTFKFEKQKFKVGYTQVIGCDEVGRGSLAGPVVAAAVIMPPAKSYNVYKVIKDSKLLLPKKREELSEIIKNIAVAWSIAEISAEMVDELNIHNASLTAMKKAILSVIPAERSESRNLKKDPNFCGNDKIFVFVDGKFQIPNLDIQQQAVIAGDNKILSIAAASIIAKVYRDRLMQKLHSAFPIYNFAQHKGYATKYHRSMLIKHGLSPIHRLSFCEHLVLKF